MPDFIPTGDEDFSVFINNFVNYVAAHAVNLGVPAATATALSNGLLLWTDSLAAHETAQIAATSARTTKDSARDALTIITRTTARSIQANPTVSDEIRALMGLPIRDDTRSRPPVPTTKPLGKVDTSQRLQHTIHWRDETMPNSKAKPTGVRGAEIWVFIGPTPPSDPAQAHFVALDTASPYLLVHDPSDAGKLAHYLLRWMNTRSEPGPWSETISATITG
jgi:hypothetical protein